MENKFQKCLERKKIIPFSPGPRLAGKETKLASFDLSRSKTSFQQEDYKWATIQSYYSMFHSARALLYVKSYREKSHQCLIEAVRVFYLEEGFLDYSIIEAFQKAKIMREEADYYGEFTEENADYLIRKAGEFLEEAKEILRKRKFAAGL